MSNYDNLKKLLNNQATATFDAAVAALDSDSLDILAKWLTDIERQRERTSEEHCRLGVVLIAQLKYHIDDNALNNLAIDDNDKKFKRNAFQLTANAEWIDEIAYAVFQGKASYDGLIRFGVDARAAFIIAIILAAGDFLSNVTNFSPANDANEWLFATHTPLKRSWLRKFALLINTISIIGSYIPGSTPGCSAILGYLPATMSQETFAIAAAFMSAFAIPPGTAYYLGFHNASMHKNFQSLEEYFDAPRKDFDLLRSVETLKKVLGIVMYRALCFAFFTLAYLLALRIKMPSFQFYNLSLILSGLTFMATILNVTFSRLGPTLAETLNNDFAYVAQEEFNRAKHDFTWFTRETMVTAMINSIIAVGYGLIMQALLKNFSAVLQYLLVVGVTASIMGIGLYTQRQMVINSDALAKIDSNKLNERKKIRVLLQQL